MIAADVAETVVFPTVFAAARPLGLMLTISADALAQATEAVRLPVLPSVNVPIAVSCCLVPSGMA